MTWLWISMPVMVLALMIAVAPLLIAMCVEQRTARRSPFERAVRDDLHLIDTVPEIIDGLRRSGVTGITDRCHVVEPGPRHPQCGVYANSFERCRDLGQQPPGADRLR